MTGILPLKKYGDHSAINIFDEYSMIDPAELAEYFGFTEKEVHLTFVETTEEVSIPNQEIAWEFLNAIDNPNFEKAAPR